MENPDFYKKNVTYKINKDIEDIYVKINYNITQDKIDFVTMLLDEYMKNPNKTFDSLLIETRRKIKLDKCISKVDINKILRSVEFKDIYSGSIKKLLNYSIKKINKSMSGILSVTVFTGPTIKDEEGNTKKFSCKYDCFYCPNEPGQARSYLHDEPGVLRANMNNFDPVLQFFDRVSTLVMMGHPSDKIELLILGGTWDSYNEYYRSDFITKLFYAANTFSMIPVKKRKMGDIEEEKKYNQTAECKIIGITIETRPDQINHDSIKFYRKYGITRVQLGTQHTDNNILKKVNRGHTIEDTIKAIKLLKNSCFKIDLHIMPNLPGSTPQIDKKMFERLFSDPDLSIHQLKIYPTQIVPWTKIKKWYTEGAYIPYSREELLEVIIYGKKLIPEWVRVNRVIRDISSQYVTDTTAEPDMRNQIEKIMIERGHTCKCIRCREILGNNPGDYHVKTSKYLASNAWEYFISIVNKDDKIIGFCRLRLNQDYEDIVFPELVNYALVLELHVYGKLKPTHNLSIKSNHQHCGFGSMLLKKAEEISLNCGFKDIAVISGVGVRGFYEKQGYKLNNQLSEMMVKKLNNNFDKYIYYIGFICLVIGITRLVFTEILRNL